MFLPASPPGYFVLLVPPLPSMPYKTRRLYSRLASHHFTDGALVDRAVKSWAQEKQLKPEFFFNVFDKIAFDAFPRLEEYWRHFEKAGGRNIHLVGSGPTLFARVDNESRAVMICERLNGQGLDAYSVSTVLPL
jgi:4-diphosphocytidyl-2C-methyl-D-erythritol kinase